MEAPAKKGGEFARVLSRYYLWTNILEANCEILWMSSNETGGENIERIGGREEKATNGTSTSKKYGKQEQ